MDITSLILFLAAMSFLLATLALDSMENPFNE